MFSRYLNICLEFFVNIRIRIIRAAWLAGSSQNLWCHSLVNKPWQYTYCSRCHEVKTIRQWNMVSLKNITWETFFMKNHTQNMVEKLFSEYFLKKSKLRISGNQLPKYFYRLFLLYAKLKAIKINYKQAADQLLFSSYKVWNKSCCLIFCMVLK